MSLRDHLAERAERGHSPEFKASGAVPLRDFDLLFQDTDLFSFDVNKFLPADELSPSYVMTAERVFAAGADAEVFTVLWDPVMPGQDPLTGFRPGPDSSWLGSQPTTAMPADERTAGLLLLVGTDFAHLSASREQDPPLVRGAISGPGEQYDYVILDRSASQYP